MILTVTLNLALDVTYRVATVHVHAANRVTAVAKRAGGKGVNVARVLQALGHETLVCGLLGGRTGDAVRADLKAVGPAAVLTPIAGETRRTLAVVDEARGDATGFWEPGPTIADGEWRPTPSSAAGRTRPASRRRWTPTATRSAWDWQGSRRS